MTNDSFDALKAGLLADAPEAVTSYLDNLAEDFLRGAVKCARRIQLMENKWEAIGILTRATIWIEEVSKELERAAIVERGRRREGGIGIP